MSATTHSLAILSMLPSWARTSLVDDGVTPAAAIVGILTVALMTFAISKRSTSPPENPQTYYLPYTLRNWPWERIISPHYLAAQAESVAWLESFHPFTKKAQIAFNKCDFSEAIPTRFTRHTLTFLCRLGFRADLPEGKSL